MCAAPCEFAVSPNCPRSGQDEPISLREVGSGYSAAQQSKRSLFTFQHIAEVSHGNLTKNKIGQQVSHEVQTGRVGEEGLI